MTGETVVSILAAVIACAALYFNWRSTEAAKRAAHAAEEQTEIQRQLRIDAALPYVWVDIRPDDATGTLINLVIGNSGPTVATNVKITVEPDLPSIAQTKDKTAAAQDRLAEGIPSLPPGRTYNWCLGQGFALINEMPSTYRFTVSCDGPFGAVPEIAYFVDLSALDGVLDRPSGTTHELTKAVRELSTKLNAR